MSELSEFLDRKLNNRFEYEISDNKVIFRFDTVLSGENIIALEIDGDNELEYFQKILDGRAIDLVGNSVEEKAKVVGLNIKNYSGKSFTIGNNTFFW